MIEKPTDFELLKQSMTSPVNIINTFIPLFILLLMSACLLLGTVGCHHDSNNSHLKNTADYSSQEAAPIKKNKQSTKNKQLRVMTPDWGIAAELTAMGYPPVAAGDLRTYPEWVGKPILSPDTIDLGERFEPNLEILAQMEVDLVLDSGFYQHLQSIYGETPVMSIDSSLEEGTQVVTIAHYIQQTRAIANAIKQPEVADSYVKDSQQALAKAGKSFIATHPLQKKFAVIQIVDSNNMRMYSHNSIFEPTLDSMGLKLVALDKGNAWGFINIKTADLIQLEGDTCLLIIEPFSPILQQELNESLLWQRLGYAINTEKPRCMGVLPPTWIYGGISSMVNIAVNLQEADLTGLNMSPKNHRTVIQKSEVMK